MGRADLILMLVLHVFFFSTCSSASLGGVGLTNLPLVHLQENQQSKVEHYLAIQGGGGGSNGGHMGGSGGEGNGGSYPKSPAYGAGGGANIHRGNHHRGGTSVPSSCCWGNTAIIAAVLSAYLLRDVYLLVL